MKPTRQQKQLRRAHNLINEVAQFFEDAGFDRLSECLDPAAESIQDLAGRLEALGFAKEVVRW